MSTSRPSATSGKPLASCPRYTVSVSRPNNVSLAQECLNGPRDVTLSFAQAAALSYVLCWWTHRRNFGGEAGGGANAPPIFFLPKNIFLATELKRGNNKIG